MGYVLSEKVNAGDLFKIVFEKTGTLASGPYVLCYGSDGSLLTRTGAILSGESFAVAVNAEYTVIVVFSQTTGGGSGTFTLTNLEKTN